MIVRVTLFALCAIVIAAPAAGAAPAHFQIVQPGIIAAPRTALDAADPLVPEEWWRATVHVDTLTPPGPGVPVTIVTLAIAAAWLRLLASIG